MCNSVHACVFYIPFKSAIKVRDAFDLSPQAVCSRAIDRVSCDRACVEEWSPLRSLRRACFRSPSRAREGGECERGETDEAEQQKSRENESRGRERGTRERRESEWRNQCTHVALPSPSLSLRAQFHARFPALTRALHPRSLCRTKQTWRSGGTQDMRGRGEASRERRAIERDTDDRLPPLLRSLCSALLFSAALLCAAGGTSIDS